MISVAWFSLQVASYDRNEVYLVMFPSVRGTRAISCRSLMPRLSPMYQTVFDEQKQWGICLFCLFHLSFILLLVFVCWGSSASPTVKSFARASASVSERIRLIFKIEVGWFTSQNALGRGPSLAKIVVPGVLSSPATWIAWTGTFQHDTEEHYRKGKYDQIISNMNITLT